MTKMNLSQYQFTLSEPYQSGQMIGELEANVLNFHRSDLIRKIVLKWVTDAERDAPDGVLTVEQMDKLADEISQFDLSYSFSLREDPKLPAFNHLLRLVAISEITKLGPAHLIPDFERRIELASRHPENRDKARRQLVASLKSLFDGAEEND